MKIKIRKETPEDYEQVFLLVEQAFREMEFSNLDEQFQVERLRKSEAFIPELSLVAETEGKIVGHILLTRMAINNGSERFPVLGLAPVSVLPAFQRLGVGGSLIEEAHRVALNLGYTSVVLVGHPGYYPRFGYKRAGGFGLRFPFEAPDECCMAVELAEGALDGVWGMVEHPKEFF